MDDGDADSHDKRDESDTAADGDAPTWADLFGRAAAYGVDESAVREELARRREPADE